MISYETAKSIALCYQDIKAANELLEKCNGLINENGSLSVKDDHSDRVNHMQLHLPSGFSGHTIVRVDDDLAIKMIIKQIEEREQELKVLNILAKRECIRLEETDE